MNKITILFLLLILFASAPAIKAQNTITFMGGTVGNTGMSLSFSAGEVVSGTFSNSSFSVQSGFSGNRDLTPTSLQEQNDELPKVFSLAQNFPNPFNPTTTIRYELPSDANVRVEVFNTIGIRVAILAEGHRTAGLHTAQFNASNLASGMYLYRFMADGKTISTKKMMFIK